MRLLKASALVCASILIASTGAFATTPPLTPQQKAQAAIARNLASLDRGINTYKRTLITVRCEKIKRFLCSDTYELCRTLGGVVGEVLTADKPISCNNARAYCGYSDTLISLATKALVSQSVNFPKKVKPLISRVARLNADLDRMNQRVATKIAKRNAYQGLCDLDPIRNKGACRNAATYQAAIDKLINVTNPPIVALKQELIAIYTDGIASANTRVNSLISPDVSPVATAIRVLNSYIAQKEMICARVESACATPVPTESPTPEVTPTPSITPTLNNTPTPSPTPTPPIPTPTPTPATPTPTPFVCVPATDSQAPVVSNLIVISQAGGQAIVSWTTDRAADGIVNWGDLPSYGNSKSDFNFASSHAIAFPGAGLSPLPTGVTKYWMIRVCSGNPMGHCTSICARPVLGLP